MPDCLVSSEIRRRIFDAIAVGAAASIVDLLSDHYSLSLTESQLLSETWARIEAGEAVCQEFADLGRHTDLDREMLLTRFAPSIPNQFSVNMDTLADGVPETLITHLIYAANQYFRKPSKFALATSVRNEGPWLLEWISHYKRLKFEPIIIVYNDCDDGSEELLKYLHEIGEIIAIKNVVSQDVSPQKKAFNAVLHLVAAAATCEWISFLDADEFIVPLVSRDAQISKVVEKVLSKAVEKGLSNEDIGAILIHWRWFASPLQYEWTKNTVGQRFRYRTDNEHVKSISRTSRIWSMSKVHVPTLAWPSDAVNSSGDRSILVEVISPPCYGAAQLNHYFAKSFQEFALKKVRGRGAVNRGSEQRSFDNFLWGSQNLIEAGEDEAAEAGLLQHFVADETLISLDRKCRSLTLERLARIESELNLSEIHNGLTAHLRR
jgi:hypothetical protein